MKKIFFLCILTMLLIGCGEKTFKEINNEINSENSTKDKILYIKKLNEDKNFLGEDLEKIQNLYNDLQKKLENEEKEQKIKALLPPRDGFSNGVAFSVKNFLKENMGNLKIKYIRGGNTLRLTNGLFYQNVKFKISSSTGQSAIYNSYFLIRDNEYTSNSVVDFLETSDDFYKNYLKKNKIETAEDEIFDYYFKK